MKKRENRHRHRWASSPLPRRRDVLRIGLALGARAIIGRGARALGAGMVFAAARRSPARAQIARDFSLIETVEGIYTHVGVHALAGPANGGDIACATILTGTDTTAIVDTSHSPELGRKLRTAARALSDAPIAYVINTHVHPDHIFGNAAFVEDHPLFLGHRNLERAMANVGEFYRRRLEEILGPGPAAEARIIPPKQTVDPGTPLRLDLGGRVLRLDAWPTSHTDNDLSVVEERSGTLIAGDLVFVGHIPTLHGSLPGWRKTLDRLEKHDFAHVVPGHGQPSADAQTTLGRVRNYLDTLERDVRRIIDQGGDIEQAARTAAAGQKSLWKLFADFNPVNASRVFSALEWE